MCANGKQSGPVKGADFFLEWDIISEQILAHFWNYWSLLLFEE